MTLSNYELEKIGFERLKILNPKYEIKDWYFTKLLKDYKLPEVKYSDLKNLKSNKRTVNPANITATIHEDYDGLSWIEMLGSLKRFNITSKEHALKVVLTPVADYMILNKSGNTLSINQGNHRFCLSRFLEIPELEVMVNEIVYE